MKISGVEIRLRDLGRRLELDRIHPHKFRRTMATRAIDKGMPIEQVQKILGHSQIKMLSILLSSEMEVEDKKRRLSDEFEIAMTKEMESEALNMCDYSKMVEDKGIIKGVLNSIKNLMETTGMNIEQAMNALKVPEKDRPMYISKIGR